MQTNTRAAKIAVTVARESGRGRALDGRGLPKTARIVSIGPVTSETARELGIDVHAEAERHDIDGLVDALLADAASSAPR